MKEEKPGVDVIASFSIRMGRENYKFPVKFTLCWYCEGFISPEESGGHIHPWMNVEVSQW
jgi:hypothetical protein